MRENWDLETTVLLISLAIIPVLLAIIILCLKIKSSKSNPDLYGVEGTVKKTSNNENSFNGIANTSENKLNVSGDDSRHDVRTPSYDRKLPDIPNDDIYKNSSTKDDNSELYATVDEVPNNNATNGINPRPELNSLSVPGPSNYDAKNHPYAKVKKTRREEHPYAKVGESKDQDDNTDTEEYDTTENLRNSNQRASGRSLSGASGWRRPDDIPRNPSRQATPLPPEPPVYPDQNQHQQHFSGDSQDSFSTKGYTSISVREPLAMIRDIRNIGAPQGSVIQEGNYVTLSETSDEMYAAIEDTVYMNPGGKDSLDKEDDESDPNNMYSKVDKVKKKTDRNTKSYDASNPYATVNKPSTVNKQMSKSSDNLGARPKQRSPRVGARVSGNVDTVDYSEYEVSHTDRRPASNQPQLFNMARSYHEDYRPRPDPNYETLPPYAESQLSGRDPGYEIVQSGNRLRDPDYETVSSEIKDPGYEVVSQPRGRVNSIDPGYETVPQKREPGYESVKGPVDPGYETVHHTSRNKHSSYGPRSFPGGYETVSRDPGYESVGFRDPGYETVNNKRAVSLEPGYETLPERVPGPSQMTKDNVNSDQVYSVVNKKQRAAPAARLPPHVTQDAEKNKRRDAASENNSEEEGYETIPADKRKDSYDPGYETLPQESVDNKIVPKKSVESGYEVITQPENQELESKTPSTDHEEYEGLKEEPHIEFIDESADELEDGLADLKTEDLTVDSSHSSLIQMSVVDTGPGVRRSSVVVIEHVPGAAPQAQDIEPEEIQTHIFV